MSKLVCLTLSKGFKPGDPVPSGYLSWSEWARVQHRAGLRQRRCWKCGLWQFPQEECCGPQPAGLYDAGFTVDDVISGRKP